MVAADALSGAGSLRAASLKQFQKKLTDFFGLKLRQIKNIRRFF